MDVNYSKDTPLTDSETIIFEKLKKWRLKLSKKLSLKPFIVAYDVDLIAITKIKPSSVEAEKLGFIERSMTNNQAIGTLLAQYILMDEYEYNYGPQIMFSLVKKYCDNDILESFTEAYYIITKYRNITQIPLSQFIATV